MQKRKIHLSNEFKVQATKAILAIMLFVLIYIIILVLAIGLTAVCIAGGVALIVFKPMFITIALGAGLASMGVFILIFLLKFIFKSNKSDRSHLIEIKEEDEPALFSLIHEIVKEVRTSNPKKVYLSADVNASVFYDSGFWSMFLPVKKNLIIGLGLVNTITREELKAILSHEFGHFSQKTMKVGSYVYNVNQVIFNMLYDNDSYNELTQRWANASGYFSIFITIANAFNEVIQDVLKEMYGFVNKSYMGLSREMEFHADEIAASITGFEPLKNSLLRMTLADNSFSNVLQFYDGKIAQSIKSENIYRDQTAIFTFLAEQNNFHIQNNLPTISLEEQSKFDKSKLVIKNQWASHPSAEERIKRLEKTGFSTQNKNDTLANNVFKNIIETQKMLTAKLFEGVKYEGETSFIAFENFQNEYREETLSNSFSKIYNGYYNNKSPSQFNPDDKNLISKDIQFQELFSDEKVDRIYTAIAIQNDIETLKNISNNSIIIKTFDYDGKKYKKTEADNLIAQLNTELENLYEQINCNDILIYEFFNKIDIQNNSNELAQLYQEFFAFDKNFDTNYDIYIQLSNELRFVNENTPFEQINTNLKRIKPIEATLKSALKEIMENPNCQSEISEDIRDNSAIYLSKELVYFKDNAYNNENLNIFYQALHNYAFLMSRVYFLTKKKLLNYQEGLSKIHTQVIKNIAEVVQS